MKVLHIITRMNTGGPAVFLDHLTNAMSELGTQSTIAYGDCESNESDFTQTHTLNAKLVKVKTLHRSLNLRDDFRSFLELRKIINELKPDIINTHTSKAGVLGRLAAKLVDRNIPIVHTYHGHLIYGYFSRFKAYSFALIERFLARFTSAAVFITHETQQTWNQLSVGKKIRSEVIRLGIPINIDLVPQSSFPSRIKLLWVGRFTSIKDPMYAIEVLRYLENNLPGKYFMKMIGGGELLDLAQLAAKNLPVDFSGWVDNPFRQVDDFNLLMLTSINEGMGLVVLEAANLARPTISRDIGGVGEFIEDNVTGFLVKGNPELMAQRILQLSIEVLIKVGTNARSLLVRDFSDSELARNYHNLYNSLLK